MLLAADGRHGDDDFVRPVPAGYCGDVAVAAEDFGAEQHFVVLVRVVIDKADEFLAVEVALVDFPGEHGRCVAGADYEHPRALPVGAPSPLVEDADEDPAGAYQHHGEEPTEDVDAARQAGGGGEHVDGDRARTDGDGAGDRLQFVDAGVAPQPVVKAEGVEGAELDEDVDRQVYLDYLQAAVFDDAVEAGHNGQAGYAADYRCIYQYQCQRNQFVSHFIYPAVIFPFLAGSWSP